MGVRRSAFKSAAVGAVLGGSVSSITTALTGAVGAAIMAASKHDGYSPSEAAAAGAAGGAILGAIGCGIAACSTNLFSRLISGGSPEAKNGFNIVGNSAVGFFGLCTYPASATIGGLIGNAILKNPEMGSLQTFLAFGAGSLTLWIPLSLVAINFGPELFDCVINMSTSDDDRTPSNSV